MEEEASEIVSDTNSRSMTTITRNNILIKSQSQRKMITYGKHKSKAKATGYCVNRQEVLKGIKMVQQAIANALDLLREKSQGHPIGSNPFRQEIKNKAHLGRTAENLDK